MGAGRSGSTILGIMLGNIKDCFFAGELHLWNKTKGVTFNDRPVVEKFWETVLAEFPANDRVFSCDFDKKLEYHSAVLSLLRKQNRPMVQAFHQQTTTLLSILQSATGKTTIIDSSHYPLRGYWLNKNKHLNVSYVYLYRNPVYVIQSFRKKDIEQPAKTILGANLYLFVVSVLSNLIYFLLPSARKTRISYEDLIQHTDESLAKIEAISNIAFNPPFEKKHLLTGFIFRSNRIRHKEAIDLENDIKPIKNNIFLKTFIYSLHWPFIFLHAKIKG